MFRPGRMLKRGTVNLEQEWDPAPIRPLWAAEHRRIGILWACCWYFDTECLGGLMTQQKKGSRSCLYMSMRVPFPGCKTPCPWAYFCASCCGVFLTLMVIPECACACLTRLDDILPSIRGGCLPQPRSSLAVTILVSDSNAHHLPVEPTPCPTGREPTARPVTPWAHCNNFAGGLNPPGTLSNEDKWPSHF